MATHCDICGIHALSGQSFAQERLPFRRPKTYCPACHRRFYERVYILLAFFIFVPALIGIFASYNRGTLQLATIPVIVLVLLLQYPLTIAHEAGHAFFARLFHFHPIRVLIGSGKALFHFQALKIIWIFNRIPIGGLCYATPSTLIRKQWVLFGAGGLIVNAAILLLAWLALRANNPIPQNILHALLWANALVIVENILPYTAPTSFGPLATDGKLLFHAIFRWNKSASPQTSRSKASTFALRIFKTVAALFLVCCGIIFFFLAAVFFTAKTLQVDLLVRLSLSLFFVLLGSILLWSAWRIHKQPLGTPAPAPTLAAWWLDELHSKFPSAVSPEDLSEIRSFLLASDLPSARDATAERLERHPRDVVLMWVQSDTLLALNEVAAAERTCDLLIDELLRLDPSIHYERGVFYFATAKRLHAIMLQNDGRFKAECTSFLQNLVLDAYKVAILDQLACIPLIHEKPELYDAADFCIRHALDLAPRTPTLHGTFGALLAERGQYTEAKPYLHTCYNESDTPTDRGITSYYLALLAAHNGNPATARKLARQSIALHPEPWLTKKANTLLARLKH